MATTVNSTGNLTTAFGTTGASVAAATTATGMFFNDNYGDFLNELVGLSSLAGNSTSMSGTLASGATFTLTGTNLGGTGDWGITSLVLTNGTESFTLTGAIPFDGTAFTGPEVLTNVEIVTNLGTQEVTGTGLDIDVSGGDLAFSAGSITTENTIVGTVSVTLTGTVNAATGAGTITGITLTEGLNTVTASGSYDAVAAHAALAGATTLGDLFQNAGSGGALLFGGDDQLIVTGPTAWFGFAGSDTLTGDAGDNTLDGGTGNDKMIGGGGNDTFIVDDGADSVTGGAGVDTVRANIHCSLTGQLDNLVLTGSSDLNGSGNSLANTITGNTGNNSLDGAGGTDTLFGGDGNDYYSVQTGDSDVVVESGTGTDTVEADGDYTLGANVENLVLSSSAGDINGTGNTLDNSLTGNGGDNTLDGGTGADVMIGGGGNDTFVVDDAGDSVTADVGTDTVRTAISYTLGSEVENLTLTGSGNIDATGNTDVNILTGNAGNNTLDGSTGADTMIGGGGNDTYVVDNSGDSVTGGAGTDTVRSGVTYVLGTGLENLTLTGSTDIDGTGNGLANNIVGNTGDNTLDGAGGTDLLSGGDGDDYYVVQTGESDVVSESGTGTDTVEADGSYVLGGGVENLILTGTGNFSGTGNGLANTLTGNDGNNTLDGAGGTDRLIGGDGDDYYVVQTAESDVVSETGDGIDTVSADGTYTLGANIENLILTGSGAADGTGNGLGNTITGNSGANTLDGGAGADVMIGGGGNDTYVVDNAGDTATGGAGTDTVRAGVSFTIGATIENLVLTGSSGISGTGNGSVNTLTGNSGDNTLDGGAGADIMIGGGGNDTYVVDSASDSITDTTGTDTVRAGVSFTLGTGLEDLVLTGTGSIDGTGNTDNNTLYGNSGNNTLDGGTGGDLLIGGGGNDTYIVDSLADSVTGDTGVDTVRSSVSFTMSAAVENIVLTGTDDVNVTGNTLDNTITANTGDNTLSGGAGSDIYVIAPGGGADVIIDTAGGLDAIQFDAAVDPADVVYTRSLGGFGNDLIISFGTSDQVTVTGFFGGATNQVEEVRFAFDASVHDVTFILGSVVSGASTNGDDVLLGTADPEFLDGLAGNDLINGLGGNDTLDGGTGFDTLIGNDGDDVYIVDNVDDVVSEAFNEGTDEVRTGLKYTLGGAVENLTLTGSAAVAGTGNELDNTIVGNGAKNALSGLDGADTLDGGAEADTMKGGAGDDTYFVDNARDKVTETTQVGSGTDTVNSSVTFKLGTGVENLTLTGTGDINGTGGTGDNTLTGNSGDNTLNGMQGADSMIGGGGNDTYIVDNLGDAVTGGAGTDHVMAGVSYTLGADVENLTLTGSALNGDGNGLDNILTGNSRANVLNGFAGADSLIGGNGNDTLDGGTGIDDLNGGGGNDVYILDVAGDVVTDTNGTDTIQTDGFDVTLAAGLEKLIFTGSLDLDGVGNAANNVLTGNEGNNSLDGLAGNDTLLGGIGNDILAGGLGTDKLTGGDGADTFVFTSTANGKDTIADFDVSEGDVLDLQTLLTGWSGDIHDYLQVTQQGANTIVKVDIDGSIGGSHFVQIATLSASTLAATDEANLILLGGGILA